MTGVWRSALPVTGILLGVLACAPPAPKDSGAVAMDEAAAPVAAAVVDSEAVRLLQRSMDYLGNLQRFRVEISNLREDLLPSGHRVDYHSVAVGTVVRPNRIRGSRLGAGVEQDLIYDGATLTLYNPPQKAYASVPAPPAIPGMFEMASDSLGLYIPLTDLIWPDVYPLLMEGVTMAAVVDNELVGGVICTHLVFSRPGADFQIWIPVEGPPLPLKYIVTDTGTPALLSIVSTMSKWDTNPRVTDDYFTFTPPAGAQQVPFIPLGD